MAVGVPETEVFAAADRVLARGERPTTERVRIELGRGSPARIGQLLEQWWDSLAKRIAGETRLPELPPAVAEAFKAVWVSAIEHGTELAQAAATATTAQLAQDQARLTEERAEAQRAVETAQTAQAAAETAAQAAEARLGDLRRLLEQHVAQQADLTAQRNTLSARNHQLEQMLTTAQATLAEQRHVAAQEREALQKHIRATEERSHAEVDRARQEHKELRTQLIAQQRQYAAVDQTYRQQLEAARTALARAEKDAIAQQSRADALEHQLMRLVDLQGRSEKQSSPATPASVGARATIRKSKARAVTRSKRS